MRRSMGVVLALILGLPGPVLAGELATFQGGLTEAVASLDNPEFTEYINLTVPAGGIVMSAVMDVSSVLPDAAHPGFPRSVRILLDETPLWEFSGAGFGALGRQDSFLYDSKEKRIRIGELGAQGNCSIRLMKDATIKNATMDIRGSGPGWVTQFKKIQGFSDSNYFGLSSACAGDVNNDGYDDIIIGEPAESFYYVREGRACIYYGGPVINRTEDINLLGHSQWEYFGVSVSGAGDVNGDGFDDVVVGASSCVDSALYRDASRAYVYFGGPKMDTAYDVLLEGEPGTSFGISVAGAGDVNGDGYDDVVVGANNTTSPTGIGRAFVYFGGRNMDNVSDVALAGAYAGDGFGHAVSGAGDVNDDSYDDVIVGSYTGLVSKFGKAEGAGAYLFYGNGSMDGTADVFFSADAPEELFGASVSGAGDVNGDGYGDLIVGAPGVDTRRGEAYVYFGGPAVDTIADEVFSGTDDLDLFGASVADAGDLNGDGIGDAMVCAPGYDGPSNGTVGAAYLFYGGEDMPINRVLFHSGEAAGDGTHGTVSSAGDLNGDGRDEAIASAPEFGKCYLFTYGGEGIDRPDISLGNIGIWTKTGFFSGSDTTSPFPMLLQNAINAGPPPVNDSFGNAYADVPVNIRAKGCGMMTLGDLNITYTYKTSMLDFSKELKRYVADASAKEAPGADVTVPIKVVSSTPGRVRLQNLRIGLDVAPSLAADIPDLRLPEDSKSSDLLDLRPHFRDDYSPSAKLRFCATAISNGSIVKVGVSDGHYLSADALTDPSSENWTGEVRAVVLCSDTNNRTGTSNEFRIIVYNVNDPPIVVSPALSTIYAREDYSFQVVAVDGDGDRIDYSLAKCPSGMTIDSASGIVRWPSPVNGTHGLTVGVSDGQSNSSRSYIMNVLDRPIWIDNATVPDAKTGYRYTYRIPAVSKTGRALTFRLAGAPDGMTVDEHSGLLGWDPEEVGDHAVSVNISDGDTTLLYNFTIHVVKGNRAPKFTSAPVLAAFRGVNYTYLARASDEDGDTLGFGLSSGPKNMSMNAFSGRLSWLPALTGDFSACLRVYDGNGGEDFQWFTITVREYVRAVVLIDRPGDGQELKGKITVSGRVTRGSLDVESVQVRIDSGPWMNASGNSTWRITIDTAGLADGTHRLGVRAFDGNDHSDIATRSIRVKNASDNLYIAAGIAIPAVVVLSGAILLWRRRRAGDGKKTA